MSNVDIDAILPAHVYNSLIIDHEATERAEFIGLKAKHLPHLFKILSDNGVSEFLEIHLLHRHFQLEEGEALIHKTLAIPGSENAPSICVDIAKPVSSAESMKSSLVPLLWMVSDSGLIAYEYGVEEGQESRSLGAKIPAKTWKAFSQEFSDYVCSSGIADLVSLKDKSCIKGGEYVSPNMRALFRIPEQGVNLQPGSHMLESGWQPIADGGADAIFPECTDGHVTKTRQTSGGTVAHYHTTDELGINAFNPQEVPLTYTNAMWTAVKSVNFWSLGGMVGVTV
ncbi:hypothetical protein V8C40DRAFT_282131 [Trichoderma camerunense]